MSNNLVIPSMLALLLAACGGTVHDQGGEGGEGLGWGGFGGSGAGGTGVAAGATTGVAGAPAEPVCEAVILPPADGPSSDCACTRRPGPGNSWQCPMGANEFASATIGPNGGTISLTGQQGKGAPMKLEIPPGALAADTLITITETSLQPPTSHVDYSPVWQFAPVGLTFAKPVKITMPWGNKSGKIQGALASYWSADGCVWEKLPDSYINAGFENASILRFGYGFAGYPKTSATASCP